MQLLFLDKEVCECAQDSEGQAMLAMRHGWFMTDVVDLAGLDCPAVVQKYPCQIWWQKDLCEDGKHYVRGRLSSSPCLACSEGVSR